MIFKSLHKAIFFVLLISITKNCYAQTNEQKDLEGKREQLQAEIREINRLLFAEKKEKGSVIDQMQALDKKIKVRQQLIRVTNEQSNLLSRKISTNKKSIDKLTKELKVLKEDYGNMIQKSYKNKSQQSRLLFILSSENFFQAFKRLQYIKQYTDYRREQGEQIKAKTNAIATLNQNLIEERKTKESLIAQNKKAKNQLSKEVQSQKNVLNKIRKNESRYTSTIMKKKKEARNIDKQIEKLIRAAIAASNKKATKKTASSSKFVLTPEAAIVANNFKANKGKLIWPVEKGVKSQGFGVYNDAVYPGIKHESNGVIIATDKGAKARAIFDGEVIAILSVPGGKKGVQIRHGNFISTYYNLSNLYVKKGEVVVTKEELGEIYTNTSNGQTRLKFYLFKDTSRLNPEDWVYRL